MIIGICCDRQRLKTMRIYRDLSEAQALSLDVGLFGFSARLIFRLETPNLTDAFFCKKVSEKNLAKYLDKFNIK